MRALWLLPVAACWSGTPPPAPPNTPSSGSCRIREIDLQTQETVRLRARGRTFANLSGPFQRLDVTVVDATARAIVEDETVELDGDLVLERLPVRPATVALRDGWLEITRGIARRAVGDALRFDVALPDGLEPRSLSFDIKCKELSFSEPPDAPAVTDATWIEVVPGAVAKLRASPDGPVIATALSSATGSKVRDSRVVERRGALLRVRFERPNAVVAWVDAASMRDREDEVYGSLMGNLVGDSFNKWRCPNAVPLYVRIEKEVVRVGWIKAGVMFQPAGRGDGLGIDLGMEVDEKVFFKRTETAACNEAR